jgi:hypothetical protein
MDERIPTPAQQEQTTGSVLICRALHPKALEKDTRFLGRVHGVRLQVVPFQARPTYRRVTGWADTRAGCVVVRCASCGGFSEYAVVGDVHLWPNNVLPETDSTRPEAESLGPFRFPVPTRARDQAPAWRPLRAARRDPQDGRVARDNHPPTQE